MAKSQATVSTESGESYIKRLCKHWSHKFQTRIEGPHGEVQFGEGQRLLFQAEATTLEIIITAPEENLAKLESVVASHLERFATKETLEFAWHRSVGAAS